MIALKSSPPSKKSRAKTDAAEIPAPQNREEVNAAIREIGEIDRTLGRLDLGFKDAAAKVKETFEVQGAPHSVRRALLIKGVQHWCEANRRELTENGKVKTFAFAAGKVSWRHRPPSVRLPRNLGDVITFLKDHGLSRFIRNVEEVSKEQMLAEPEAALKVPGVKIGSSGEDFVIEPYTADELESANG